MLSPRRLRILSFLALHGSADTTEVADVVGVSRVTAHRDLTALHADELVARSRSHEDRTHAWTYEINAAGTDVVVRALRSAGRLVPLRLGQRDRGAAHHLLFMPLNRVAVTEPQRCQLFQWLNTMDTSAWLRLHGLDGLHADGYGVWLEDGRMLRFLVHVDPGFAGLALGYDPSSYGLISIVARYRRIDRAVPVGAVLIIADDAAREHDLLADLAERPVRAPIATTTKDLLHRHWPTDPIWLHADRADTRVRLIDLAPT